MVVFILIIVSIFVVNSPKAAQQKKAATKSTVKQATSSELENNLKIYFSKRYTNATITRVKVLKLGDVVSVKRTEFLTKNRVESLERPVLVNIKGKCKYSDMTIDEDIKYTLHKDEWGNWVAGQGTQTQDSLTWGILSAGLDAQTCPEDPNVVAQRIKEKENAEEAYKLEAKRRVAIVSEIREIAKKITQMEWQLLFKTQIYPNDKIQPGCNNNGCLRDIFERADTLLDDIELKKYNGLPDEKQLNELLKVLKDYNLDDLKSSLAKKKAIILEIKQFANKISSSEWNHLKAIKFSKNDDIKALKPFGPRDIFDSQQLMLRVCKEYGEQCDLNDIFNERNSGCISFLSKQSEKGLKALLEILKDYNHDRAPEKLDRETSIGDVVKEIREHDRDSEN